MKAWSWRCPGLISSPEKPIRIRFQSAAGSFAQIREFDQSLIVVSIRKRVTGLKVRVPLNASNDPNPNAWAEHDSALASVPRCVTGHSQAIHLDQSGFEETWPVFENHVVIDHLIRLLRS